MNDRTSNIAQFINKRKFGSILVKNIIRLSLIILLPLIIVVWVATFSFHAFTEKEILVYSNKSLAMILNTTHNMFADNMKQMNYLASDNDTTMFLISKPFERVIFYDRNSLFKLITVQMQTKEYIESIYIYSELNNLILSNFGLMEFEDFLDKEWLHEYSHDRQIGHFFYKFRTINKDSRNPILILSFYKTLGYLNEHQGLMVLNVNFKKFASELADMRSSYDHGLFLTDSELNVITDIWGSHDNIAPESLEKLRNAPTDYVKDGEFVLYKAPIKYSDWYYVSAVPYEIYQANINALWKNMFVVIGIGFAITVLATILMSVWFYQPYKKILNVIKEPVIWTENEMNISHNEEAYILNTIKSTMSKNVQITQELNERVALLRKAQSIALQSQINPHFLHNTLDTISWSAMRLTGGKNEASVMISKLSGILRYSLENVETLVTLTEELDNTRTYLELQDMRYKNKFTVQWSIDDNVKKCKVIKLMLQPILENAIHHGIRPLSNTASISIEARKEDDNLVIVVEDSGVGMSAETKKSINERMKEKRLHQKEHIGIVNVNQRIQLFFGDQYGVSIESKQNQGTAITLLLPYLL